MWKQYEFQYFKWNQFSLERKCHERCFGDTAYDETELSYIRIEDEPISWKFYKVCHAVT